MEIVMALLFTFGVLAIESHNPTSCEKGSIQQSVPKTDKTANEPFDVALQKSCRYTNEPLVQRDLTVPYPDKGIRLNCQECRCDEQ